MPRRLALRKSVLGSMPRSAAAAFRLPPWHRKVLPMCVASRALNVSRVDSPDAVSGAG